MPQFKTRADLTAALAAAPPGEKRAEILYDGENRKFVLNSGANVTLFKGKCDSHLETIKDQLAPVSLLLLQRQNARSGKADGFGGLGGLSERTTQQEIQDAGAGDVERGLAALADQKDDIVQEADGSYILTSDINIIRVNTVARELDEELADLGLQDDLTIDTDDLYLVPLEGVRDDNYLINIWDGKNPDPDQIYAITPYCHTLELSAADFNHLSQKSAFATASGEALGLKEMPLFEALQHWGKTDGFGVKAEDGRNMEYDYRYPHEYLAAWSIAITQLDHDKRSLIILTQELQQDMYNKGLTHKIDFEDIAQRMNVKLEALDHAFGLEDGTIHEVQQYINWQYDSLRQHLPGAPRP